MGFNDAESVRWQFETGIVDHEKFFLLEVTMV